MPHRPFTRRQQRQNQRFLAALRQCGNVRLACRTLHVHRGTYEKRRRADAAFATAWDAALAAAHAAFHLVGGTRLPEPKSPLPGFREDRSRPWPCPGDRAARSMGVGLSPGAGPLESPDNLKTRGGEPHIVRRADGKLQLRLAPPGRMTKAAEQAFLSALSATANIRLAAAAAGVAHATIYARRRASAAFARELRLALKIGWQRLECALIAAGLPESHEDDAWREDHELPPIPPLTPDQAIQLLVLHEKSVNQGWEQPHRRRRRGEPWETYTERLRAMWVAEKGREAEEEALRRAARWEEAGDWRFEDEPAPPPDLPDLAHVTGWSGADPTKRKHNPDKALFGGWRLKDWKKREAGKS